MRHEKANFMPSNDFLIKNQKCRLAYEELLQYQKNVIDKEIYVTWLEKHHGLYKSFDLPPYFYLDYNKFYTLYNRINELTNFLQSSELTEKAIKEFQAVDKSIEPELLKWLIRYEKTGYNLIMFLYEDIVFEYPERSEYFEVEGFKINTSEFRHIAKFKFLFDRYYWDLLEKYYTFSDDETTRYKNENKEMAEHICSLSYHINKRGIKLF